MTVELIILCVDIVLSFIVISIIMQENPPGRVIK